MVSRGHGALDRVAAGDTSEGSLRQAIRVVESAVQAATYMVFGLAQHAPEQQGMGTTVSVLAMCGDYGITAQVGDSRIYLIRGRKAQSLTEDHTLVAWQLKQGIITEAEAARSPHRNVITRAVGSREYVQVDTGFFEVQSSDAFLLCSDGLHGYLQTQEIPDVIGMGPKGAAQRFIHIANSRGGRDNITAVVVNVL
jgi:protein phosphatase